MKKLLPPKTPTRRRKGIFGIADAEWDFSEKTIPSNAVQTCLLCEYARELIRRSPTASGALKKLQQADCSGDRGLFWDSYEEMSSILKTKNSGSVLIYPYMDEVPWTGFQQLLEKERLEMIKRRKQGGQRQTLAKSKKVESAAIKPLLREAEESNNIFLGKRMVWMSYPPIDRSIIHESRLHCSVGKLFARFDLHFASFFDADYITEQSRGFFVVDLKARSPDVLADFEAWFAKEKKRAGIVDSERRGRTSETDKAYKLLKALGAYRLMTMTKKSAEGMINTFHDRIKSPPLYSNPPEWSRAKKIVEAKLRDLFVIPADAIF